MLPHFGQLLLGFVVLTIGGDLLVRAAISLARLANLSTAVIGLTVVAFGTSLPELAVSLNAAVQGATDISYANVVGSNIFNIAAILGIVAMLHPLTVSRQTFTFEYPTMTVTAVAMLLAAMDGVVTHAEGLIAIAALIALGIVIFVAAKRGTHFLPTTDPSETEELVRSGTQVRSAGGWTKSLMYFALGVLGLQLGADLILKGAIGVGTILGVSERIMGLTAIAMGTSLPELATSIIATRKGEAEIALSNLLGSNIFNTLGILGITAAIIPVPVAPQAASLDNWVMFAFVLTLLPILWHRRRVSRWAGAFLVAGFCAYMVVLVQSAVG